MNTVELLQSKGRSRTQKRYWGVEESNFGVIYTQKACACVKDLKGAELERSTPTHDAIAWLPMVCGVRRATR